MAAAKEARLILRLVDGVSGPAKGISAALAGVNGVVNSLTSAAMGPTRALTNLTRNFRRQASDLTAMSTGVAMGVVAAAKNVYELQKQLNISEAAGEIDSKQRAALLKEAIRLNGEYAATSTEIVAGANEVLKAGVSYDKTMGMLTGILDTAQAMDVPIADASAAIVNAMTAQRMAMDGSADSYKSAIKMADLYAYAVQQTTASLEDFTTSGKYFNPVAAAMGMSPDETMAWQIAMAKAGIKGSSAGTGLRSGPISIAAPTKGGRAAFASLGIDPREFIGKKLGGATGDTIAAALEAAGYSTEGMEAAIDKMVKDPKYRRAPGKLAGAIIDNFGEAMGVTADRGDVADIIERTISAGVSEIDMVKAIKRLQEAGAGVAEYAAIFGKQHASKFMAIDPDELQRILDEMEKKVDGTAKRMREKMMQGIVRDWNEFTAALEQIAVAFGDSGLLADASRMFSSLADSLSRMAEVNPELLKMAGYGALALAAMAPLGWALSGIGASLALMSNPITIVAAALGTLAYYNWDRLTAFMSGFSEALQGGLDPRILNGVASAFERIKRAFGAGTIATTFGTMAETNMGVASGSGWGSAVADGINAIADAVIRLYDSKGVQAFMDGFATALRNIASAAKYLGEQASSMKAGLQPIIDFLNSEFGVQLGEFAGQFWGYAAGGAAAAIAISAVAASISKLAGAFYLLSGAKLGVGILGSLLGGFGGGKAGTAAAGGGILGRLFGGKGGKGGKGILGILGAGAALGGIMALFKDYQGGVTTVTPPKARPNAIADYINSLHNPATKGTSRGGPPTARPPMTEGTSRGGPPTPRFDKLSQTFFQLEAESKAAGQKMEQNLAITAMPVVNTSSLDAAIAKASTFQRMLAGMGSTTPSAGGPAFGGPRAAGGPVRRGLTYLVGEEGPELFTPGRSGGITPNGAMGGGGITNHFHINGGGDAQEVVRQVMNKLDRQLSRSGQTNLDGRSRFA